MEALQTIPKELKYEINRYEDMIGKSYEVTDSPPNLTDKAKWWFKEPHGLNLALIDSDTGQIMRYGNIHWIKKQCDKLGIKPKNLKFYLEKSNLYHFGHK